MTGHDPRRDDPAADPLAQPARRRVFVTLAELGRAAGTDELAGRLGLHPNGVRTHLVRLHEAGLVVRRRRAQPRGRPRDEWAIAPEPGAIGSGRRADDVLARWLARSIPATRTRLGEVERTGREVGRELVTAGTAAPAQGIADALAALGFAPQVASRGEGGLSCRLGNCPYRDSVRANQPVVCTLHQGLTRGLLDRLAPTARLVSFVPHDPDVAGCEIEIEGLAPASGERR